MAKLFNKNQLPNYVSTRDSRNRLDLITGNVPVGARHLRADRIIYHSGDTCAKHYHVGCHHVFVILEGEGLIYTPKSTHCLKSRMVAIIEPKEIHWFENDLKENFKFIEFWAPPPKETIWVTENDI